MQLINTAERPLILAGHGIILGGAEAALQSFAEKAQIPVAMTLLGIGGFPASHPLNLGMMGMHGEAWVNTAIQEADLLIALGMRFDDRVTGNLKTYAPHAKKIHVDIDPAEFNKNVRVDSAIAGDVGAVVRDWLPSVARGDRSTWLKYIEDLKGDSAVRDIQNLADDGHLYAAHVINDLWRITEGNAIVVTDVGQHQMWEAQYYHHEKPRSLITSGGLGTMGFALPAAIGAKVGRPDAEVWVVVGDGGFQMTMCELATHGAGGARREDRRHQQRLSSAWSGSGRSSSISGATRRRRSPAPISRSWPRRSASAGATVTTRDQVAGAVADRQASARGAHRFQGGAGRLGLPDGAGRRGSPQDDSPPVADCGNCGETKIGAGSSACGHASSRNADPRRASS